ncbi:MAG: hypothetical protein HYV68_00040 [Candidatus Taylorbacteria bacterium]|nr:hypothetical protein [Candidatus Taylorbacteria bacterium]
MTNRIIVIILIIGVAVVGFLVWNNSRVIVAPTAGLDAIETPANAQTDRPAGGTKAVSTPSTEQSTAKPAAGLGTGTQIEPINTNPGNVIPEMPRAQVSYSDSGFTSIAIKKGQTVRFMNQSSKGMQVVSDSTTLNFGQTAPLMRGEYFDFGYHYVGTWKFHNGLDPTKTGIVRVQ